MKLIFKKDEESQISVFQLVDEDEKEFSYVDMIKSLIETREMESPKISERFSEAETASINSMVSFINKEISTAEESTTEGNK